MDINNLSCSPCSSSTPTAMTQTHTKSNNSNCRRRRHRRRQQQKQLKHICTDNEARKVLSKQNLLLLDKETNSENIGLLHHIADDNTTIISTSTLRRPLCGAGCVSEISGDYSESEYSGMDNDDDDRSLPPTLNLLDDIAFAFSNVLGEDPEDETLDVEAFCDAALRTTAIFDIFEGPGAVFGDMARKDCLTNIEKIRNGARKYSTTDLREMVRSEMKDKTRLPVNSGTEGLVWLIRNLDFEVLLIIMLLDNQMCRTQATIEEEKAEKIAMELAALSGALSPMSPTSPKCPPAPLQTPPSPMSEIALEAFRLSLARHYNWWMKIAFENGVRFAPPREKFFQMLLSTEDFDAGCVVDSLEEICTVTNKVSKFLNETKGTDAQCPELILQKPFAIYESK